MNKLNNFKKKVLEELHKTFHEDHTDQQIALSFAIGVFITALPTLGAGFLLFVVLAKAFAWVSKLALLASAVVLNPAIKPVFWIASINLGGIILTGNLALTSNPETALSYLIVGNLVIAVIAATLAYFFSLKAVQKYRAENLEVVEEVEEAIDKEVEREIENLEKS